VSRLGAQRVCLIGRAKLSSRSKCDWSRHVTWWCSWSAVSKCEKWRI